MLHYNCIQIDQLIDMLIFWLKPKNLLVNSCLKEACNIKDISFETNEDNSMRLSKGEAYVKIISKSSSGKPWI